MEHQTNNAYGNAFRLAPEGYDWLLQHEFAHEWFANQMTHRIGGEMWLHEGFGTYMQPLYLRWRGDDLLYHATLWEHRKRILSRVPLVPDDPQARGDYLDEASGWGNDIYYKGSWSAHTLREAIGDAAFSQSLTRLVYDRPDPAPGNFTPILRDSADLEQIVEDVTGREWSWFFDTYLLTAALPRLEVQRDGRILSLAWHTDAATPFQLPVEIRAGDRLLVAPMEGGRGQLDLADAEVHITLDPAVMAWQAEQDALREAAAVQD
jgi:aminopeptidase N